jgi:hypothetical protein
MRNLDSAPSQCDGPTNLEGRRTQLTIGFILVHHILTPELTRQGSWECKRACALFRCEGRTGRCLKVAVLLSGGVDSSLALYLLKKAGHSVTAFYLKIWFQEDFENFWGSCPWEADLEVCEQVETPHPLPPLTPVHTHNSQIPPEGVNLSF